MAFGLDSAADELERRRRAASGATPPPPPVYDDTANPPTSYEDYVGEPKSPPVTYDTNALGPGFASPPPPPPPLNPAPPIGDPGYFDPNRQGNGTNVGLVDPAKPPGSATDFVPGPDGMGTAGASPVTPLGSPTTQQAQLIPPGQPGYKAPGSTEVPDLPIPTSQAPTAMPDIPRRVTDVPQVQAAQAAGVNVLPAPTVNAPTVGYAGRTDAAQAGQVRVGAAPTVNAPGLDYAGRTTAGQAGPTQVGSVANVNAPTLDYAGRTNAPTLDKSSQFLDPVKTAIAGNQSVLAGQTPTVARIDAGNNIARLIADQRAAAASARGRDVSAARLSAAQQIAKLGGVQVGQDARLVAQEQAEARKQLGELGLAGRGQDISLATTESGQKLTAGLASDERLQGLYSERAKLKLAADQGNQQAATDLVKLDATIKSETARFNAGQTTQTNLASDDRMQSMLSERAKLKLAADQGNQDAATKLIALDAQIQSDTGKFNAGQQLQAALASDDRLQSTLSEAAKLKLQADQGNQDAAVKLQGLQATIDSELNRFNAQQLQGASADNAANFLKGVGMDDDYINAVKDQWLQLEKLGQTERLTILQEQVKLQIAKMSKNDPSFMERLMSMAAGGLAGFAIGGPAGAAAGATAGAAGLPIPGVQPRK